MSTVISIGNVLDWTTQITNQQFSTPASGTIYRLTANLTFSNISKYFLNAGTSDTDFFRLFTDTTLDGNGFSITIPSFSGAVPTDGLSGIVRLNSSSTGTTVQNLNLIINSGVNYASSTAGAALVGALTSGYDPANGTLKNIIITTFGNLKTNTRLVVSSAGANATANMRLDTIFVKYAAGSLPSSSGYAYVLGRFKDSIISNCAFVASRSTNGQINFLQNLSGTCSMTSCYHYAFNTGSTSSASSVGSFGGESSNVILISNFYYVGGSSPASTSAAGLLVGNVQASTTVNLTNVYTNYSSADTWATTNSGTINVVSSRSDYQWASVTSSNPLPMFPSLSFLNLRPGSLLPFRLTAFSKLPFNSNTYTTYTTTPSFLATPFTVVLIGSQSDWITAITNYNTRSPSTQRCLFLLTANIQFTSGSSYYSGDGNTASTQYLKLYESDMFDGNGYTLTFSSGSSPSGGMQGIFYNNATVYGYMTIQNVAFVVEPGVTFEGTGKGCIVMTNCNGSNDNQVNLFNILITSAVAPPVSNGFIADVYSGSVQNLMVKLTNAWNPSSSSSVLWGRSYNGFNMTSTYVLMPSMSSSNASIVRNVNSGAGIHINYFAQGLYVALTSQSDTFQGASIFGSYRSDLAQSYYQWSNIYIASNTATTTTTGGISLLANASSGSSSLVDNLVTTFCTNSSSSSYQYQGSNPSGLTATNCSNSYVFPTGTNFFSNTFFWNQTDQTTNGLPPRLAGFYQGAYFTSLASSPYVTYSDIPSFYNSCFLEGTLLLLASGAYAHIESLRPGDQLRTKDGRTTTIREIQKDYVSFLTPHRRPVHIPANAFGEGLPFQDLYLSGNHAFVSPTCHEKDNDRPPTQKDRLSHVSCTTRFSQTDTIKSFFYYHVATEDYLHDLINANGIWCETLDVAHRSRSRKYHWTCVTTSSPLKKEGSKHVCERKEIRSPGEDHGGSKPTIESCL